MSIRRNSTYNLVGSLAPIAVILVTVPIYLRLIGTDRYGVLAIAWVLIGYFVVFDLGLGRAAAQLIATLTTAHPHERATAFWTALALNTVLGVVGGVLFWIAARWFFAGYFQVSEEIRPEILTAVPWLAAAVPVATISNVLSGTLQGRQRFLSLNVANVLGSIFSQLLPLCVAWLRGPSLIWLVPTVLMGRLLLLTFLFDQCRRHVPLERKPSISRHLVPRLVRYGGWVTATGVVNPLLAVVDQFVIGALAGARAVAHYSVPYSLANRMMAIPASLAAALFPRFAAAQLTESDRLLNEAVRVLLVLLTPPIIAALIVMKPFLSFWLDETFAANSATVGQIFLLGFWALGLSLIPHSKLQAQGRPDLVAKCRLAELAPYLIALYLGLTWWGIVGAAVAWALRVWVDCMLLFSLSQMSSELGRSLLVPGLLIGCSAFSILVLPNGGTAVCTAILVLSLVWAWNARPESMSSWLDGWFRKTVR